MAQDNQDMRYNLTTYSEYSHDHLLKVLTAKNVRYEYVVPQGEQYYSRFNVLSNTEIFEFIKNLTENNDGTAITLEYGTY
jgi:hypothetical protein